MGDDIIEVYEYEDGSGVDCPFRRDVESIRVCPYACDHPKNEMKKVDGVWEGDCGLEGGRDVIPKHCPLRRRGTIIRLRQGGGHVSTGIPIVDTVLNGGIAPGKARG